MAALLDGLAGPGRQSRGSCTTSLVLPAAEGRLFRPGGDGVDTESVGGTCGNRLHGRELDALERDRRTAVDPEPILERADDSSSAKPMPAISRVWGLRSAALDSRLAELTISRSRRPRSQSVHPPEPTRFQSIAPGTVPASWGCPVPSVCSPLGRPIGLPRRRVSLSPASVVKRSLAALTESAMGRRCSYSRGEVPARANVEVADVAKSPAARTAAAGDPSQPFVVVAQHRLGQLIAAARRSTRVSLRGCRESSGRRRTRNTGVAIPGSRASKGSDSALRSTMCLSGPAMQAEETDAPLDGHLVWAAAEAASLAHPRVIGKLAERAVEEDVRDAVIVAALVLDAVLRSPRPCAVIGRGRLHRDEWYQDVVRDQCCRHRPTVVPVSKQMHAAR